MEGSARASRLSASRRGCPATSFAASAQLPRAVLGRIRSREHRCVAGGQLQYLIAFAATVTLLVVLLFPLAHKLTR